MNKDIGFEILPHTADFRMRIYGKTLEELFTNGLIGMFIAMHPFYKKPHKEAKREIVASAAKTEYLLINFLSECLYLSDAYNEAYDNITIQSLSDTEVVATVRGAKIDGMEGPEIKAVTYHDIGLHQHQNVWQATIVFDI